MWETLKPEDNDDYKGEWGIHVNIDPRYPYTARAWHILTSKHEHLYKHEYYHDEFVDMLVTVLAMEKHPGKAEQKLQELLGDDEHGQRTYDKYLQADIKAAEWFDVPVYKKKRKKWEPEMPWRYPRQRGLSYDAIAGELMRNFVKKSYQSVFPTEQDVVDFLEEYVDYSPYQLELAIENYMDEDDDEDDEELGMATLRKREEPEAWRGYLLASMLLWKSKSTADLERAAEVLEDVENRLKDEFSRWQELTIQEEFRDWWEPAFSEFLRLLTCMSAFHLQEEICDTFDDLNDAEKEVNDNDVVIYNFLLDIMMYMVLHPEASLWWQIRIVFFYADLIWQ